MARHRNLDLRLWQSLKLGMSALGCIAAVVDRRADGSF
jgi:hypothetical protein